MDLNLDLDIDMDFDFDFDLDMDNMDRDMDKKMDIISFRKITKACDSVELAVALIKKKLKMLMTPGVKAPIRKGLHCYSALSLLVPTSGNKGARMHTLQITHQPLRSLIWEYQATNREVSTRTQQTTKQPIRR
jgi:hypothetical protein